MTLTTGGKYRIYKKNINSTISSMPRSHKDYYFKGETKLLLIFESCLGGYTETFQKKDNDIVIKPLEDVVS